MATTSKKTVKRWIDLNDTSGAKLKIGTLHGKLVLVIDGCLPRSPEFQHAISKLNFIPSKSGRYLVRTLSADEEKLSIGLFHPVWPRAVLREMNVSEFKLDFEKILKDQSKKEERAQALAAGEIKEKREDTSLEEIQRIVDSARYLGRNMENARVFSDSGGRFYISDETAQTLVREGAGSPPALFLHAVNASGARDCAKGLLVSCQAGEAWHHETLLRFAGTIFGKEPDALSAADKELLGQAIDVAALGSLMENAASLNAAWGIGTYYQEMMPGRASLTPDTGSTPYLPLPLAVQLQRFLEGEDVVLVEGRVPGSTYGLLPDSTQVYTNSASDAESWIDKAYRPSVFDANEQTNPAGSGYWHISEKPSEENIRSFFNRLSDSAICVITTNDASNLDMFSDQGNIVRTIKIPDWLAGTKYPIYLSIIKNTKDQEQPSANNISTIHGWDDLKTLADETLLALNKKHDDDITSPGEPSIRIENRYQRPYLAFSKVGPSSTMVPQNLQSALGNALARVQDAHGPIDQFVADELGIGDEMLASLFSPEQVDATGLAINRIQSGRGFILGDETGIGKGRVIAAAATWANKQGKRVIFITDRSNLFSDLARDLIDIQEWDRFRPVITNTDGKILDIMGNAEELVQPMSAIQMKKLMRQSPDELSSNIIFTTYSQINTESSDKADWLKSLCNDALVICDESHIAAGSDSNITRQVQNIVDGSWGVLYSSATWAKSSKNLHIYARAMPESVNINQVITTIREEGDSFAETFSSMLAADGAFIRREHDLSKIDFIIETDTRNTRRNTEIVGQVSEILGMMTMVSGEINHMLQQMNGGTRTALMEAQDARKEIQQQIKRHEEETKDIRQKNEEIVQHSRLALMDQQEDLKLFLRNSGNEDKLEHFAEQAKDVRWVEDIIRLRAEHENIGEETTNLQLQQYRDIFDSYVKAKNSITEIDNGRKRIDEVISQEQKQTRLFTSSFGTGGAIYQAMRRTLAALSVDHTAEKAIQSAQSGRRPVIVFEDTGESFVQKLIREEYTRIQNEVAAWRVQRDKQSSNAYTGHEASLQKLADTLDASTRPMDVVREIRIPNLQDMMRELLSRLGGVKVTELGDSIIENAASTEEIEVAANWQLKDVPGIEPDMIERYQKGIQAIVDKIEQLPPLPIVPVDALRVKFDEAGLSLGEISGRQFSLIPINHDGTWKPGDKAKIVKRARKKSDVTQMVKTFNSGKVDGLIINKSAATGLSIHASPRFEDSRQRELFEMQTDENPTNRIQLFGRVNRFDQVIAPRIVMMTTGLRGEQRTIMMQNKKLKNLSANIRSSRENAALIEDVPDLLNITGDRICQEYLLENPGVAGRLDIPMTRINIPYGLSHLVTQRIALLAPTHQDKVYEDLRIAYESAQIENNLAQNNEHITVRDWHAKTVSERIAWGPSEHLEALSVFDGPVYQREVEFTEDFQPWHWDEVSAQIADSSQRLAKDNRIKPLAIQSVDHYPSIHGLLDFVLEKEKMLTSDEAHAKWADGLLESMAKYLPPEALETKNVDIDFAEKEGEEQFILKRTQYIPKGFESLGGHWLAVESRVMGTRLSKRLMALISRSGKSAKLWFLNGKGQAEQYLMNIDKAILSQGDNNAESGTALKQLDTITIAENGWHRNRFNEVWGSLDPKVKLLDLSNLVDTASTIMESKQIIALQGTNFSSIDEAMKHPEHNAVKEASFRKHFFERIIHKLTPGTQIHINPVGDNQKFISLLGKDFIITNVKLPDPGQESTLSRWQFEMIAPGLEKPVMLSGSLLFKLGGLPPYFNRLSITGNLYSGMGNELGRSAVQFNRFEKGPVKRRRTLLVGNMFQAGTWARDTKRGISIVYRDDTGQRHRAIEIGHGGLFSDFVRFPLRLFDRKSIVEFMRRVYEQQITDSTTAACVLFTSFKGVLVQQNNDARHNSASPPDRLVFDTHHNSMGWMVNKNEKDKIRRMLRSAIKADTKEWESRHKEPYPVNFSTHVSKANKGQQVLLSIKLPESNEGRIRFFDLFVKTLGLEIFVPDHITTNAVRLAKEVERERYERLAQPAIEELQKNQAARNRRMRMREMLNPANASVETVELKSIDITVNPAKTSTEVLDHQPEYPPASSENRMPGTSGHSLARRKA